MEENKIGYKNPPPETRFKSGQSGNPKGRPRGSLNIHTIVEKEGNAKVDIKEGDKRIRATKREVIIKSVFNRAMAGDKNYIRICIELLKELDVSNELKGINTTEMNKNDREIFENFKKSLLTQEETKETEIKKETIDV